MQKKKKNCKCEFRTTLLTNQYSIAIGTSLSGVMFNLESSLMNDWKCSFKPAHTGIAVTKPKVMKFS